MSSIDTDTNDNEVVEEVYSESVLGDFMDRWNKAVERDAIVCDWHVKLYMATGIRPPYFGESRTIYCTQEVRDEDDHSKWNVDVEATRVYLAKVTQYAASRSEVFGIEKPEMTETDKEFKLVVTISDDPNIKVTYTANREVVCTPIMKKVYKPQMVTPAKFEEEIVGYNCEKVSFLAIDTGLDL